MPTERIKMLFPDVIKEFPTLEEWFSNPENRTAQLQNDKRLMSAQEKLELVGGKNQIKSNLAIVPRSWRDPYTILLACRQEHMVGYEIGKFGKLFGKEISIGSLYVNIAHLIDSGELRKAEDLTYILRVGSNPNQFDVSTNRQGYKTTEEGLRKIAQNLVTKEQRKGLEVFLPFPTR